jgi:hypothetical protein
MILELTSDEFLLVDSSHPLCENVVLGCVSVVIWQSLVKNCCNKLYICLTGFRRVRVVMWLVVMPGAHLAKP